MGQGRSLLGGQGPVAAHAATPALGLLPGHIKTPGHFLCADRRQSICSDMPFRMLCGLLLAGQLLPSPRRMHLRTPHLQVVAFARPLC